MTQDKSLADLIYEDDDSPGPYDSDPGALPVKDLRKTAEDIEFEEEEPEPAKPKLRKRKKVGRHYAAMHKATRRVEIAQTNIIKNAVERAKSEIDLSTIDGLPTIQPPRKLTEEQWQRKFVEDAEQAFQNSYIPMENIPEDLADRARYITAYMQSYAKDFILDQLEKLIIAEQPVEDIAAFFKVTVRTIYNWQRQLRDRYSERASELKSVDQMREIGKHIAWFEWRMRAGHKMAAAEGATRRDMIAGMHIAETSHVHMLAYLERLGMFESKPLLQPAVIPEDTSDKHTALGQEMSASILDMFRAMRPISEGEREEIENMEREGLAETDE